MMENSSCRLCHKTMHRLATFRKCVQLLTHFISTFFIDFRNPNFLPSLLFSIKSRMSVIPGIIDVFTSLLSL